MNPYYQKLQKLLKSLVEHKIIEEYNIKFRDKKVLKGTVKHDKKNQ